MWVKGSRLQAEEGPTAADPGSPACETLRLLEASGPASCAAGSSCTLSPQATRPPTAGSIFPGLGHMVQVSLLWGRAGRQEQQGGGQDWGGGGHTSREWRESSLGAERPLCTCTSICGQATSPALRTILQLRTGPPPPPRPSPTPQPIQQTLAPCSGSMHGAQPSV